MLNSSFSISQILADELSSLDEASEGDAGVTSTNEEISDSDTLILSDGDAGDSTSIIGKNGYGWNSVPSHPAFSDSQIFFSIQPGPTFAVRDCQSQLGFFHFLIDGSLRQHILSCTNKRLPSGTEPITDEEFQSYIAILLLLGATKNRMVFVSEIWAKDSPNYVESVSLTMSRLRFHCIAKHLTSYDVDSPMSADKLHKMRHCFMAFSGKCLAAFEPYANICIDEELFPFRGNCRFRQYMPNKPSKYGIKYWCACDVKTSYLCNFDVYLGRNGARAVSLGQSVVENLTRPFLHSHRNITCDSYFTSIPLVVNLWNNGLIVIGTLRKNKPEIPRSRNLNPHNFVTKRSQHLSRTFQR